MADINLEGAEAVAEECRKNSPEGWLSARVIKCDVTKEKEVKALVEEAVEFHGRIDYYVHSAGVRRPLSSTFQ